MLLCYNLRYEGIDQISTRRLNQDCLENFFGKIRQQVGISVNPTPYQFMHAFKKLSCMDLLDCAETFNCAADFDSLLMNQVDIPVPVEQKPVVHENNTFKLDFISTNISFESID
ncbi:uncharacterized protein LOC123307410 [Coccinella septempunctata]|uniref:uncharacterized protein LOC123307410 n=1 Tax=Coccinella septempunctata TaxID=41139 RepID=UPI001D06681C|nr:uncharacterized protein LOC123307410 [Coccinella septempunctata]